MESTNYSLNMKAHLDTTEVTDSLSKLNQSGNKTTRDLEVAVKRLDNAVQDLTRSWERQAQAAERAARSAENAASTSGGGSVGSASVEGEAMDAALKYFNARRLGAIKKLLKNTPLGEGDFGAVAAGGLGSAAKGATIAGAPGAVAGAIIGVVSSFKDLENSSKAAAAALQRVADTEKKDFVEWYVSETQKRETEKTKEAMGGMTDDELFDFKIRYAEATSKFDTRLQEGQADWQTDAEYKAELEALKENRDKLKELSTAAQKELDARVKAADAEIDAALKAQKVAEAAEEAAQKLKERNIEKAMRSGGKFATEMDIEAFGQRLGGMSVEELQGTISALKQSREAMKGSVTGAWAKAQTSGSAEDIEAAQKQEEEFDTISDKLRDAEHVLSRLTKLSSADTGDSLNQLMGDALNSEAKKGYDVSGYASVEDAIWKQQLETQNNIKKSAEASQKSLETLVNKVEIIQTNMNNNSSDAATWGG